MKPVARTFRITGPSPAPARDPRITPARPDLADIALAGSLIRPHYAAPVVREVAELRTPLLAAPLTDAECLSELLMGEHFAVLDIAGGWAWGYGTGDGHVGHVAAAALGPTARGERRLVGPGDGLVFEAPSIKATVAAWLPAGAALALGRAVEPFHAIVAGALAGRFVHRRHLMEDGMAEDWVAIAEAFVGTPYRWGGRTRAGIDCSGLVQIALRIAGHAPRRDSDLLFADAGPEVSPADAARGDLAWWPGHIGVMVSGTHLLHANAHWMTTLVEPLDIVAARIAASGGPPPRLRRAPAPVRAPGPSAS